MPAKKSKKAGDEGSPAPSYLEAAYGKATEANRKAMLEVTNRLLREIKQEREQERTRMPTRIPFPAINPKYFSIRRNILCGIPVNIEAYNEMQQNTPFDFWNDIDDLTRRMISSDYFTLERPLYKVEIIPFMGGYKGQITEYTMRVTTNQQPVYGNETRIPADEFNYVSGTFRNGISLQQFMDFKFCEAVEEIKSTIRRQNRIEVSYEYSWNDNINSWKEYFNEGNTTATAAADPAAPLTQEALKDAIRALSDRPEKSEQPKKPKEPPSPFSMIEVD